MSDSNQSGNGFTAVSLKPETAKELKILKAEKGFSSYDALIRADYLDDKIYK